MAQKYSQVKGMLAITKGSLRGIFRSPSTVIFSFIFPLIFILVFGFLGSGSKVSVKIAFEAHSDASSNIYQLLKNLPGINIVEKPIALLNEDLEKGRITAILNIQKNHASASPENIIKLRSSEAVNPQNIAILQSIINGLISSLDKARNANIPTVAIIDPEIKKVKGRTYRTIDFILPGQLGFSLLSTGVFGVAFVFFNLRNTLVLKRFFATPIKRGYIVLGEAISRLVFQLIGSAVIILLGRFVFGFTLIHGLSTALQMLALASIGLIVFMGFGFVVSGIAKSESVIPPLANVFTLPQFLLSGTFFPIDAFPGWLQIISKALPLTYLNDALRKVAFEGAGFSAISHQLSIITIWGIVIYIIAIRFFRWE